MSRELVNKVAVNSCVFFLVKTEIMHYLLLRSLFRAWLHIHPDQRSLVPFYNIRRETTISFTWELSTTPAPATRRGAPVGQLFISTLGELHMGPRAAGAAVRGLLLRRHQPPSPGALFSYLPHVETSALQQDPDDGRSPSSA